MNKENRHMVLGNHEDMMIHYNLCVNGIDMVYNGGQTTLDEIGQPGIEHFCTLLEDIPYLIEVNHLVGINLVFVMQVFHTIHKLVIGKS